MGKSLPPWISVPESDAKGRNSTAVSNAQLTPTMDFCQGKGRGKGETTTISICLGPERLLNQRKILFAQGHADRSRQVEPRSSSRLFAQRRAGTTAQAGRCELAALPAPDRLCPPSLPCHVTPNTRAHQHGLWPPGKGITKTNPTQAFCPCGHTRSKAARLRG